LALELPTVTLVCLETRYPRMAEDSLHRSSLRAGVRFASIVLFTTAEHLRFARAHDFALDVQEIAPIASKLEYSRFVIGELPDRVRTEHVLVTQWDSWVINAAAWSPSFLDFDYIGAPWPWLPPPRVGNGGFSLRSRRMLEESRRAVGPIDDNEDTILCRRDRAALEARGVRFADEASAARFAFERGLPAGPVFGFHGMFHFDKAMPAQELAPWVEALPAPLALAIEAAELAAQLYNAGRRDLARTIVRKRLAEQPEDPIGMDFARQMWTAGDPDSPLSC